MPWTVKDPPSVARNWTEAQKKKCVSAANAVLADGGKDREAIFACIRAAGKTQNPGGKKAMDLTAMFRRVADFLQEQAISKDPSLEKKEQSLSDLISQVRNAWHDAHNSGSNQEIDSWVEEVFATHLIARESGKLVDYPWAKDVNGNITFGEGTPVVQVYVPAPKGGMKILKQEDGNYRWVGWVSNHFRDKDDPPEIISGKAHQEYVAFADEHKTYPELWLWHTPGSKVGQFDMLDFADGFLIASGTFDEKEVAERLAAYPDPLTMSHMFFRLAFDAKETITESYRMLEGSILPSGPEANPFTRFQSLKEVTMLSQAKKDFLSKLIGEDRVKQIEGDTEALKKAAEHAGVDWKAVEALDAPTTSETPGAESEPGNTDAQGDGNTPQMSNEELVEALVGPVADRITERLQMNALSDKISSLSEGVEGVKSLNDRLEFIEKALKALGQSEDEKLAQRIMPKKDQAFSWMREAPSRSTENLIKGDDPADQDLAAKQPGLSEVSDGLAAGLRATIGK